MAGDAGGGRMPADHSALVRYARAAVGPIGGAGAQFVLALVLLARLPAAGFGCFAFLMVVTQLGLGVWGALFAAPLLVAAVQREGVAGLAGAALAAMVPAGVAIGVVAWATGGDGWAAMAFGGFGALLLTRQVGRTWHLATGAPARAMASDLVYAGALLAGAGVLALSTAAGLRGAACALLAAAAAGFAPLVEAGLAARAVRLRPRDLGRYGAVWRRDSRWSLLGVVTTELTGNCHAYVVTGLAGAAAFAPIAAAALLIRPVTVGVNALTEFERAHFARCFAAGNLAGAVRARGHLHAMLLALWALTAVAAAGLMWRAPQVVFHGRYPLGLVGGGVGLWFVVALARSLHSPEGAILQAAGAFRPLAFISVWTCGVSLVAVLGLVLLAGPVWSIAGIALGEACFAVALWRAASRWLAHG